MKNLLRIAIIVALASISWGQDSQSCLIVKHKGTVGRRLIYFALIGVPIAPGANYDYVDSTNFPSPKMSYKGKQLERIQSSGTHVIVLDKSTPEGVAAARQSCAASVPASANGAPAKQVAAPPVSVEHPIEGSTLSAPENSSGSVDGDETSVAEAARQAKAKKQQDPQEPKQ